MTDTIEDWARAYVLTSDLDHKRRPPRPPSIFAVEPASVRLSAPGRPPQLEVVERGKKAPKPGALVEPAARARLLHTFWHHELQAAELFAWALLAFPETPERFRRGLLGILLEELAHMRLYEGQLERLGFEVGAFPVRDWFWLRVPTARDASAFLALVGLGLEAANLDHGQLWAERLAAAGDDRAAAVQARVAADEERHVAFAVEWFEELGAAALDFDGWCAALPPPLSPLIFRGRPLAREARMRAGQDAAFLDALEAWSPEG